jgi:septum formation protein
VILLASRSPQRRALMARLGVEYRVVASGAPERTEGIDPTALVIANALAKARDVAARAGVPDGGAVLGADTEVVDAGEILGKPADAAAASATITRLAGRTHEVITGLALITQAGEVTAHERTKVRFRPLSDVEIAWYVATGEWRDRAGGYAIQGSGAALCAAIEGDVANVVGLPVARVSELLAQQGMWPPP